MIPAHPRPGPRFRWRRALALLAASTLAAPLAAQGDTAGVLIRARVERAQRLSAGGEPLHSLEAVQRFYGAGGYRPAWTTPSAVLPVAMALSSFIDDLLPSDGLNPDDYHARAIRRLLPGPPRALSPNDRVELDLLLTDAFLTAGHDLLQGRVPPRVVHPGWTLAARPADLPAVLAQALARGRVGEALIALRPPTAQYNRLRQALARYRAIDQAGGWPSLPRRTLHAGDTASEVRVLRARLQAEAPLPAPEDSARYDSVLVDAVKHFQRASGLSGDGTVGPATRGALNVPADQRVRQLVASLERERWLPTTLGSRYIAVYIPQFELMAVDSGRLALTSRVVAGKEGWHTPIFSARMTRVIFNPYWNIPPSILQKEVLPRQARDPSYFANEGIEAVPDGPTVRYRQVPGPRNPLGRVKLLFPNSFNVYLHDTSSPYLFDRDERAFSHGCVRVEKPMELAAFALAGTPGWPADSVLAIPRGETERGVALAQPLPVYIFYRTAWVDDTGTVQFRRDVYALDEQLLAALASPDPSRVRPPGEKAAQDDGP
jgi:murein L,D-transpeptidase YcbB/YkuD